MRSTFPTGSPSCRQAAAGEAPRSISCRYESCSASLRQAPSRPARAGSASPVSATIGWAASAVLPDLAAGLVAAFFAALVVLRLRPVAVVEDVVDGVGEPAFAEGFFRDERLSGTVPVTSIDR